jgi:glycosyltransferase involved in cell wall biosynthesis
MESEPWATVVIPLYNKERHIARAMLSVLNQTFSDFELIVVDDGSTDTSAEVAKTFKDPRIRLVHREHINSWGGHAARNLGIAEARADLIVFLDADDAWLPEHLATIGRLATNHPECGAYATGYSEVLRGGRTVTPRHFGIPDSPWEGVIPNYLRSRLRSYMVHTSAVAVKRNVFAQVGVFPEGERRAGDDDMWIRIALRYDIAYSHYPRLIYHRDADNRISDDKTLPFRLRLFDTLATAAESGDLKPGISRDDVAELRNAFILQRIADFLPAGKINASEAKAWLQETASTRLLERKWKRLHMITSVPGILPAWRLETRLVVILYGLGVRRPRFLARSG